MPVFKIKNQVQIEKLERQLERLKETGDMDQVYGSINAAFGKKIIDDEAAKGYYEKYKGISAQSGFDKSAELSEKGSFHKL